MDAQSFQNEAMQNHQLHLADYASACHRKKNYVPNFYIRGVTALILFALVILGVIAANA